LEVLILVIFGLKDKPPSPPCVSEIIDEGSCCKNAYTCLKDSNVWSLLLIFGIVIGFVDAIGIISGIVLEDYEYSDGEAALFGLIFLVGGLIGSLFFGYIVEKQKNYRQMLIFLSLMTMITTPLMLGALGSR